MLTDCDLINIWVHITITSTSDNEFIDHKMLLYGLSEPYQATWATAARLNRWWARPQFISISDTHPNAPDWEWKASRMSVGVCKIWYGTSYGGP